MVLGRGWDLRAVLVLMASSGLPFTLKMTQGTANTAMPTNPGSTP